MYIVVDAAAIAVGGAVMYFAYRLQSRRVAAAAEERIVAADRVTEDAHKQAEALKKEAIVEAKEESYRLRSEIERDNRERRSELQRLERRLAQKEESLDRRTDGADKKDRALQHREAECEARRREIGEMVDEQRAELQRISRLTPEEARDMFLKAVEQEYRHEAARLVRDIEEEAKREGDRRARHVVAQAIQRCAVDQTSETTVSVVPLPNDEMKGRIIGREGRNIRAFETMTGVDLVIDDTPEAVVLSGFDPVRREVARLALSSLVTDGRIHPGRIEESVKKAQTEVAQQIEDAGARAILETGVTGVAPEIVHMLGKMRYRMSYGQNVLAHSLEVSHLAGLLASEMGADVALARRAGLLHDLGKAVDHEVDGAHAMIAADILRECREAPNLVHAVEAHHGDVDPSTVEAVLVMCADAISASRPGARREAIETYIKRVKRLEEIAQNFQGVDRCFAVQAGREVRLMVRPDQIDDFGMATLAHDIAKRIEDEMEYPGQIKVTVIRETRVTDYAK